VSGRLVALGADLRDQPADRQQSGERERAADYWSARLQSRRDGVGAPHRRVSARRARGASMGTVEGGLRPG